MPISRTIQPIGQRINKPRFIDAGVLRAAGSSGTPALQRLPRRWPSSPVQTRRQSPGIRAAWRSSRRTSHQRMRIALLRADIDLSCAEAAPTNRRTYQQILRRGGKTVCRSVIPLHSCTQFFPAGKREAFAHAHLFAVAQDWCPGHGQLLASECGLAGSAAYCQDRRKTIGDLCNGTSTGQRDA